MDLTSFSIVVAIYLLAIVGGFAMQFILRATHLSTAKRKLLTSLALLVIFSMLYFAVKNEVQWLQFLWPSEAARHNVLLGVMTVWWLSFGFTINAFLTFFIWRGIFLQNGEVAVPKILTGFISTIIYLLSITAIVHLVYGESIVTILAASGVIAVILGYSAQTTLGQIFSGLTLNLGHNIRKGDWIRVEGQRGQVLEMNWRSVTMITPENTLVILPNNQIAGEVVVNETIQAGGRWHPMWIILPFTVPPGQALPMLIAAALDTEFVKRDPAPKAFFRKTETDGAHYELLINTTHSGNRPIESAIQSSLWYRCRQADIELGPMKRWMAGRLEPVSVKAPVMSASQRSELLGADEVFSTLPADQLAILVAGSRSVSFGPPQRLFIEGGLTDTLYIVGSGKVVTSERQKDGSDLPMRELEVGAVVGLKAALTGEPRRISVRALEDSLMVALDRNVLVPIFKENPSLIDRLAEMLAEREVENIAKAECYDKNSQKGKDEVRSLRKIFAKRMKELFKA